MPELIPVDHDPFAMSADTASGPQLVPVDHDPFAPKPTGWRGVVADALAPFTNYPGTYADMNRAGRATMAGGFNEAKTALIDEPRSGAGAVKFAKGVGTTALGAVETALSPVNAALRTVVGQPVEAVTGLPKEYSELAASMAVPGIGMTRMPNMARARPPTAAAPTVQELKAAASKGYESQEVAAVEIKAPAVSQWSVDMRTELTKAGLDENVAPKTWGILTKAERAPPSAFVTGQNLESLRKTLGSAAGSIEGAERKAASQAIEALDSFLPNVAARDVIAGEPAAAAATLAEARGNWSAAKHAETINKKEFRAELRAAAANSGQNVSNTMRQRIADILLNDKDLRGFSRGERALMQRIVEGTPTENALRMGGNFLGGGGGVGGMVSMAVAGHTTGGPGAVAPIFGWGMKKLGNAMTRRDVDKLNELIRSNSPLGKQMAASAEAWSKAAKSVSDRSNPRTLALVNIASRNFSNNLRDAGVTVSPDDLLRSIQGPVRAGAEDEEP